MPGLECIKIHYYTDKQNIDYLFGFFYCSIETPLNAYLGLLLYRNKSGINFPLGKWKGWYFSEQLKFVQDNGYKIKVIKGYIFNREKSVFDKYINKLYEIKSNFINSIQKHMAKAFLNQLLGNFAIELEKSVSLVWNKDEFEVKSTMHKITSYRIISDNKILVTYVPRLDNDIIKSHGLDIVKIVKILKKMKFSLWI